MNNFFDDYRLVAGFAQWFFWAGGLSLPNKWRQKCIKQITKAGC
jgi:hypothetical protein